VIDKIISHIFQKLILTSFQREQGTGNREQGTGNREQEKLMFKNMRLK
jgi:hypothetical protein